jgi:LacI family transcriptional regulator
MSEPHTTTLRQIAAQIGVSETTVSRILTGQARRYRISPATEANVKKLAEAHNFVPNQVARGLRLSKTQTLGLIIPDISNPFFATIARQITLDTRAHGYSVFLCDSQESVELEQEALALLQSRRVEGLIVCPVGLTAGHLETAARSGLPMVLVDRYFQPSPLPFVGSDNFEGARQATAHLVAQGHRCIACLQGLRHTTPNEERLRGFRSALEGLPGTREVLVGDSFGEASGNRETEHLLNTEPEVTAILAFSNLLALGAIQAIAQAGRHIPGDISVVAFDDNPYAAHLATPLTTVSQATEEMGRRAVELLFAQLRAPGQPAPSGVLLPMRLLVRASVSPVPL